MFYNQNLNELINHIIFKHIYRQQDEGWSQDCR